MTPQELAETLFANLDVYQTKEFALAAKSFIMNNFSEDSQKVIADQMEEAGIIITGIPCKRTPT